MARRALPILLALLVLLASGARAAGPTQHGAKAPTLTQVGVIDALLAGGYDGSRTLGELRGLGDLGLGTFDKLDGEMVLLDGVVYQVPFDGHVRRPDDGLATPFAQVARFTPSMTLHLPAGAELKDMEAALDKALEAAGQTARFAAVRLDGRFAALTARSVPAQARPYRPLAEVAKGQAVFRFADVSGTLIGLKSPDFARGLSVPGWHWHFLNAERSRGGHVLGCRLAAPATAGVMSMDRYVLLLPEPGRGGMAGLDLARDRSEELRQVEGAR